MVMKAIKIRKIPKKRPWGFWFLHGATRLTSSWRVLWRRISSYMKSAKKTGFVFAQNVTDWSVTYIFFWPYRSSSQRKSTLYKLIFLWLNSKDRVQNIMPLFIIKNILRLTRKNYIFSAHTKKLLKFANNIIQFYNYSRFFWSKI